MAILVKIIAVGLCCVSAVVGATAAVDSQQQKCEETSVLILGAGVSGITAGQALHNHSVSDFIILEYNNEIGGRCRHAEFGKKPNGKGGYVVELGANWIQGVGSKYGIENPIYQLCKKYNVKYHLSDFTDVSLYNSKGAANYAGYYFQFQEALSKAEKQALMMQEQGLQDQSLRAALTANKWQPLSNFEKQAIEYAEWDATQAYSPDESSQIFGADSEKATFGVLGKKNDYVIDQRGYNHFIYGEASSYLKKNDPRLRLNSIIENVTYSDDSVTVQTKDNKCYKAKYAICTFSVGVLQNALPGGAAPVRFYPEFPEWKTQAITGMAMGIYTKIYMQFDPKDQFWPDNQFFLYASPTTRGYYPIFQSLSIPGFFPGSGILFVTVVTPQSRVVEAQSDEETMEQVLEVLRQMFPKKKIPKPKAFMYPRWGQTEWAFGSYSNWPAGYTLQQHQNLRANLGRLWFAGEATSTNFWGYLQGGWYSGQEMGTDVAHCVKGNKTRCKDQARYPILHSTMKPSDYNKTNGWMFPKYLG